MKKLFLSSLLLGCLLFPQNSFAEGSQTTLSSEQSVATSVESSFSSDSSNSKESVTKESTISSTQPESNTTASNQIEKDYSSSPGKIYKKGDTLDPNDFKTYLEEMSGLTLTDLKFPAKHSYETETLDLHKAQIIATDATGQEYLFSVTYLVKNNVATLKIWDVHFDQDTKILSGKKSANSDLYVYGVGLETQPPIFVSSDFASEHFSFQFTSEHSGRLLSLITYSPASVEYSEPYTVKLPLFDGTEPSQTESTTTSEPSSNNKETAKNETAQKKTLPSTGEYNSTLLTILGVIALALGTWLLVKKVKK